MYDLVITGARLVRPGQSESVVSDIGVAGGRIIAVGDDLDRGGANIFDATGLLAFPGAVDAHCHWGIYNPLEADAITESRAATQGGVTTAITYFRTGQYYLNKGGSYQDFFPEVLERARGRSHIDYAFHLAPIERRHIEEIPILIERFGVPSFKIFMFYGGHGLHGRSDDQAAFLMTPPGERYDLAHFEFVMRGAQKAREAFPESADRISVSLHCETAETMTAYTEMVEADAGLQGLAAYSESRPPHSEGLAIMTAAYLAHETGLTNINLLHLSSAKAVEAARVARLAFPDVDIRTEVTIGHLLVDVESSAGLYGKVNPPIRPRSDVEALWGAVADGTIDWVVSDHACCPEDEKLGDDPDDLWSAKSGFGGSDYLLAGLFSEATRRGVAPSRVAELVGRNPSRRYGLEGKGDIAPGFDADIALLDPEARWTVTAATSESSQGYTPFEGLELTGRVEHAFLRGHQVLADRQVVGDPVGVYVNRSQRRQGS